MQFLTIIPVKPAMTVTAKDIARSTSAFVIVGLIQGLLLIFIRYLSGIVFEPDLTIGLILLVLVLSNGGFHLDGLADTFDALAVKASGNTEVDIEKRLSVMKDAAAGPIGVTAIVFALGIKYLALKSIFHMPHFTVLSSLMLMPMLSKWTMVVSMFIGKPARKDGLGKIFIDHVGSKEIFISTFFFLLPLIGMQVFLKRGISNDAYFFYPALLAAMFLFCRFCAGFLEKKIGGLNGDTLGAISEITEILFLLLMIIWSRLFT